MKRFSLLLACGLAVSVALPSSAQEAPTGWRTQIKADGAKTFTPSDLKTGESYNVTLYDAAPLNGKTPEAFVRDFAGSVGTKPGQLSAPLDIKAQNGQAKSGFGLYNGPNGKPLFVVFIASSRDGRNIFVSRTLFSHEKLFLRYQKVNGDLLRGMGASASTSTPAQNQTGRAIPGVPAEITARMTVGGALVPGVYVGEQIGEGKIKNRYRVTLYANGEYRITDAGDKDFIFSTGGVAGLGKIAYDPKSGQLNLDEAFALSNGPDQFCFYGRDAAGQPIICSQSVAGEVNKENRFLSLRFAGPPKGRLAPGLQKKLDDAKEAKAAADKAERERFKWTTAPGKGVGKAQIEMVLLEYKMVANLPTHEVYLLLRDGTIYRGLPVPPDQLDIATSRAKEPENWGKWKRDSTQNPGKSGRIVAFQVSWPKQPAELIGGEAAIPASPQTRLSGNFETALAGSGWHFFRGIAFDKSGRFAQGSRGGSSTGLALPDGPPVATSTWDEGGSGTTVSGGGVAANSVGAKSNPDADRQGTYSLSDYGITLRYDNGRTARLPFFFTEPDRKTIWFGGNTLENSGG